MSDVFFHPCPKPVKEVKEKKFYHFKPGKHTKANIKANNELKDVLVDIENCEFRLSGCKGLSMGLQNCHRHKRKWYYSKPELLYDRKQVLKGCPACHDATEYNRELNEQIFMRVRGKE